MPGERPSRLVQEYLAGDPSVAPLFGPPLSALDAPTTPRAGSLLDAAGRRALAAALRAQPGFLAELRPQADAIDALEEEATLAVLTGQQPGLFLGSLLTLYKALSAVALARRLAARHRRPVVPLFWIVAEDDDLSEIDAILLAVGRGVPRAVRLFEDGRETRERVPYAALEARRDLARAAGEVAAHLGGTPGAERIAALVADAARRVTPVGAFARLLGTLLGPQGLVVVDPSDPALKRLLAPLLRREIRDPLATAAGGVAAARRLEALGLHAQVTADVGRPAFFTIADGRRTRPLAIDPALAERPELVVPNVLLRPVCQDFLFPTAAVVGGPAEIAYHAQLGEVYARHGVPRPIVVPRLSAILAEPEVARTLDAERADLAALRAGPAALAAAAPAAAVGSHEIAGVEGAAASLADALARLEARLAPTAPPLAAMAAGARRKIAFEVGRVRERARRELDQGGEARRKRIARARERLFPDGRLQERVLSPLPFLARWERLPEMLLDVYDPTDARPALIRLPADDA
jgi:uncharacterized protein YllA (UPF0747 family)